MRVEKLYREYKAAIDALNATYRIDEALTVSETARKTLAIAAASAFERDVTDLLVQFVDAASSGNSYLTALVRLRLLERQFHTLFEWKSSSAANFFGNFGQDAKKHCDTAIKNNSELSQAIRDFLDLGNVRNEIVHRDYATYPFDKTLEDVILQYRSAKIFLSFLEQLLKKLAKNEQLGSAEN